MNAMTQPDDPALQAYGGDELPPPALAVASVIVSVGLVAIGNGLLFAFIPVRLAAEGFAPTWAGAILTGLSAGGMAGCFLTGAMVRRVGHARVFMTFSAIIILSNATISIGAYPALWIASRALYGLAISGLFIVTQSWLNDVVDNTIRGRVTAIFYVTYVVGVGVGSFMLRFIDIDTPAAPIIGIAFAALSIIPVGMTRLRPPPPPETASIALGLAWRISPVGLAGMLAVGGMSMMVAGFAPIHATATGLSKNDVALLMFAMPLGTILVQLPAGWISDRTDRRYVLIAASLMVIAGALLAARVDGGALLLLLAVYMLWSGATESIYAISSAHANDRAGKGDLVALSSTMLFAWSLSGFLIPGGTTLLTAAVGTQAFMHVAVVIAVVFCAFVAWRVRRSEPAAPEETGEFTPLPAQAPPPAELAFTGEEAEALTLAEAALDGPPPPERAAPPLSEDSTGPDQERGPFLS